MRVRTAAVEDDEGLEVWLMEGFVDQWLWVFGMFCGLVGTR